MLTLYENIVKLFKCPNPNANTTVVIMQCCGSGSVLDPYSGASWIRIRIPNTDPDPHMQI